MMGNVKRKQKRDPATGRADNRLYRSNHLRRPTWFAAPAELDGRDVEQVHAVQVVVDEELQQVGDVALVGLVALVHHGAAL